MYGLCVEKAYSKGPSPATGHLRGWLQIQKEQGEGEDLEPRESAQGEACLTELWPWVRDTATRDEELPPQGGSWKNKCPNFTLLSLQLLAMLLIGKKRPEAPRQVDLSRQSVEVSRGHRAEQRRSERGIWASNQKWPARLAAQSCTQSLCSTVCRSPTLKLPLLASYRLSSCWHSSVSCRKEPFLHQCL